MTLTSAPPIPVAVTLTPRRMRLVLAVMALSLMAVVSAVSGLNVALPSMARETGATQTELTWIVDAYTVVFAGLLLIAGALGIDSGDGDCSWSAWPSSVPRRVWGWW